MSHDYVGLLLLSICKTHVGVQCVNLCVLNNGFIGIAARMLDYTISATQDSAYNIT